MDSQKLALDLEVALKERETMFLKVFNDETVNSHILQSIPLHHECVTIVSSQGSTSAFKATLELKLQQSIDVEKFIKDYQDKNNVRLRKSNTKRYKNGVVTKKWRYISIVDRGCGAKWDTFWLFLSLTLNVKG